MRKNSEAVSVRTGRQSYACFTSIATPQGPYKYRYKRVELQFPRSAHAPNGATARYRYRVYARDGTVQRVANCVVPATKIAVQAMSRRFGVRGEQMAKQKPGSGGDDGMISIQACVTAGIYGIVVNRRYI